MAKVLKSVHVESDDRVAVEVTRSVSRNGGLGGNFAANDPVMAAKLAEAQARADALLEQARAQIAAWQEEAHQVGWQAGHEEGLRAAREEVAESLRAARSIAQSAVEARDKSLKESGVEIGRLAVAVAEKISGRELAINPEVVTDIVAQVIEAANLNGPCRIRVNTRDYESLSPHWEAVAPLQQPGRPWELVADRNVARGDCVIEAGGGTIDGQVETQLEQVRGAFEKVAG